jgi:hypothetical protein
MARVRALKCKTCKALQGERHRMITPRPTDEVLKAWKVSGQAEATDGCPCEPDGLCQHGHYSWLVSIGWVQPNPKARPKKVVKLKPAARKGHLAGGTNSGLLKGDDMKKSVKKEKSAGLVAGIFRASSSGALIYGILCDGKPHKEAELKKAAGVKSITGRMARYRSEGKQSGRFILEKMDDGRFLQKNHGKVSSAPVPKAKLKPNGAEKEAAPAKKVVKKTPPPAKTTPTVQDDAE